MAFRLSKCKLNHVVIMNSWFELSSHFQVCVGNSISKSRRWGSSTWNQTDSLCFIHSWCQFELVRFHWKWVASPWNIFELLFLFRFWFYSQDQRYSFQLQHASSLGRISQRTLSFQWHNTSTFYRFVIFLTKHSLKNNFLNPLIIPFSKFLVIIPVERCDSISICIILWCWGDGINKAYRRVPVERWKRRVWTGPWTTEFIGFSGYKAWVHQMLLLILRSRELANIFMKNFFYFFFEMKKMLLRSMTWAQHGIRIQIEKHCNT